MANAKSTGAWADRVYWEEDEWNLLADIVWKARKKDPAASLVSHVQNAQVRLPVARRRNITGLHQVPQLTDKLSRIDAQFLKLSDGKVPGVPINGDVESPEDAKPKIPTKDEILATMSDEEVFERYGSKILLTAAPEQMIQHTSVDKLLAAVPYIDLLAAFIKLSATTVKRELPGLVADIAKARYAGPQPPGNPVAKARPLVPTQTVSAPAPAPAAPPPAPLVPHITVVGLMNDQQHSLNQLLHEKCRFHFVDKNREGSKDMLPSQQDCVVLATNFIGHKTTEHVQSQIAGTGVKLMRISANVSGIARELEQWLDNGASLRGALSMEKARRAKTKKEADSTPYMRDQDGVFRIRANCVFPNAGAALASGVEITMGVHAGGAVPLVSLDDALDWTRAELERAVAAKDAKAVKHTKINLAILERVAAAFAEVIKKEKAEAGRTRPQRTKGKSPRRPKSA